MNRLLLLVLIIFSAQLVWAQNLSTKIARGYIDEIISTTNQGGYNGIRFVDDVNIFPNPFKNHINVRINNIISDDVMVYIYNTNGELSQSMKINKEKSPIEYSVSLDDLCSGLYFVEIRLGDYRAIKKINKI